MNHSGRNNLNSWDSKKCVLWTLDWTVDWTVDSIMDSRFGLEFRLLGVKSHVHVNYNQQQSLSIIICRLENMLPKSGA